MPELLDAQGNPISTGEPTAAPEAPKTAEDVAALRSQLSGLNETINQLKGVLEYSVQAAVATGAANTAARYAEPEITDDEINRAISAEENPAAAVRRLTEQKARQQEQRWANEFGALRQQGLGTIARLVETTVNDQPHFKEFEREIKQFVGALPVEAQINPDVWKIAYNAVVGAHSDEIVKRETEAVRRQNRDTAKPADGGQRGATLVTADGKAVVAPEEVGDVNWLAEKGQTPDAFAQKLGHGKAGGRYKDWADYASRTDKNSLKAPDDGARLG